MLASLVGISFFRNMKDPSWLAVLPWSSKCLIDIAAGMYLKYDTQLLLSLNLYIAYITLNICPTGMLCSRPLNCQCNPLWSGNISVTELTVSSWRPPSCWRVLASWSTTDTVSCEGVSASVCLYWDVVLHKYLQLTSHSSTYLFWSTFGLETPQHSHTHIIDLYGERVTRGLLFPLNLTGGIMEEHVNCNIRDPKQNIFSNKEIEMTEQ